MSSSTNATQRFQGVNIVDDLDPCGMMIKETRGDSSTYTSGCQVSYLDTGTVVFVAATPLSYALFHSRKVRAVGVVMRGLKASTDVYILEGRQSDDYEAGKTCRVQNDALWTLKHNAKHKYVMSAEHKRMLDEELASHEREKVEKRKRARERAADRKRAKVTATSGADD